MEGEPVIEKILSDARAEAQKIKKEAEERQSQEQARLDEQLRQYHNETNALAQKAGAEAKSQVLSAARMVLAKERLAEKAGILDEVFAEAQRQLTNLGNDEYRKLMVKLMADAVETGDEEVVIDNNEKRIDQSLIEQVNVQRKSNLKLAGQRKDVGGGFILTRGKIKNNCSLKVLLSRERTELEIELAKQLFAD